MIHDRIENLKYYIIRTDYEQIKTKFLDFVTPDMEERQYEIDGDRIYARVMSYETKHPDVCKLEAHDKFIDIQCTIVGAEGIDVYNRSRLSVSEPYNMEKDVIFYYRDENASKHFLGHLNNLEGFFTLLKPDEVHSPQQRVGNIRAVKKYVIKYAVDR